MIYFVASYDIKKEKMLKMYFANKSFKEKRAIEKKKENKKWKKYQKGTWTELWNSFSTGNFGVW